MPEPESKDLQGFQDLEDESTFKDIEEPSEEQPADSETPSEEEQPEESAEEAETPEEPKVPYSRFSEVNRELKELKAQISQKEQTPVAQRSEQEVKELEAQKWLQKQIEQALTSREEQQHAQDAAQAQELVELMEIYGEFDVDKVLDLKEQYAIGNSEKALKLYFETQKGVKATPASKPRVPQPQGTSTAEPAPDTSKFVNMPFDKLMEETKRDYKLK